MEESDAEGSLIDHATVVEAKYGFEGRNNDELSFQKNDTITITQQVEGGWWEGTLNGKTGWFPQDYVRPVNSPDGHLRRAKSPIGLKNAELSFAIGKPNKTGYRKQVLKAFLDSEKAHVTHLNKLCNDYLKPIKNANVLSENAYKTLVGNIEEIVARQEDILCQLDHLLSVPSQKQRVGNVMLSVAPVMKCLFRNYCENHPAAADVITSEREKLDALLKQQNLNLSGLITGLSQPFRHIEKYSGTLQELERNMEEGHPDRGDTQRAASVYRDLAIFSSNVRKQKEMQMELLSTGLIREWDSDEPVTSLGQIKHMGTVAVRDDKDTTDDRCLVAFGSVLLILEITPELNSYILKGRIDLRGAVVRKLDSPQYTLQLTTNEEKNKSLLTMTMSSADAFNHWLEAFTLCNGLTLHESCNTISPTVPQKYGIGHVMQSEELSPSKRAQVSILPAPVQADVIKKSTTLPAMINHQLRMILPESDLNLDLTDSTSPQQQQQRPLSDSSKLFSGYCLRPYPAVRGNYAVHFGKKSAVKLRKTASSGEQYDAEVQKVIEAYCAAGMVSNSRMRRNRKNSAPIIGHRQMMEQESPQLIVAEDERMLVEDMVGDQLVSRERSLVDTVYALKDQINSLQKEMENMGRTMEKEQRARRQMEELVRRSSACSGSTGPNKSLTPNISQEITDS